MSDFDKNEFAGSFTPSGQTDYVAMVNNDVDPVDAIPDQSIKIPTQSSEAVDLPKPISVGDVGKTLSYLHHSAVVHGAVVDSNMESLFKHYCALENMDERDVELWVRGYVYATGSQVGPRITEVTEVLKNEVRSLQRTNATLIETVKLLATQAVSVEKEIATATVNIKADITSALKSALEGQAKFFEKGKELPKTSQLIIPTPDLARTPKVKDVPEAMKVGQPSDPSSSTFSDKAQFAKMRAVMKTIGVEQEVLDYITDDELAVIYPEEELREYMDQLSDPNVRALFLEEINKNIEDRLLA